MKTRHCILLPVLAALRIGGAAESVRLNVIPHSGGANIPVSVLLGAPLMMPITKHGPGGVSVPGQAAREELHWILPQPGDDGRLLLLDFDTRLTAVIGDVELGGDPEHAGCQYRPHATTALSLRDRQGWTAGPERLSGRLRGIRQPA